VLLATGALGLVASVVDIRTRRIPNVLTAGGAAAGLAMAVAGINGETMATSLVGLALGVLFMLPGHVFGATGAGDVKLFGAFGALLGPERVFAAFLLTAISGGVLALAVAARRGCLARMVRRTAGLVRSPADASREVVRDTGNRFPYGPAIAVGCLLAAWGGA
jgi:prepilin peptidase CpaA